MSQVVVRGVSVGLVAQVVKAATLFVGTIVISRYLGTTQFGVAAAVMVVGGIAQVLADFGLSAGIARIPDVPAQVASNLFWANLALGMGLGGVVALLAPVLSQAVGAPGHANLFYLVAVLFPLGVLSGHYKAIAASEFRFALIAIADVVGQLFSTTAAILLALNGFGPGALVMQLLIAFLVTLTVMATAVRRVPGLPRQFQQSREVLNVSSGSLGTQALVYATLALEKVIVSRLVGLSALGLYEFAQRIARMPAIQLAVPTNRVAIPVLGRLQTDLDQFWKRLRSFYSPFVVTVSAALTVTIALADRAIPFLMGESWESAVVVVQIIALGTFPQILALPLVWVFTSLGLTTRQFAVSLVSRSLSLCLVAAGACFGLTYAAIGSAVGSLVNLVLMVALADKLVPDIGRRLIRLIALQFGICGGVIALAFVLGLVGGAASAVLGTLAAVLLLGWQAVAIRQVRRPRKVALND
ncbi:oligosaccharide flippase family protein [Gordonia alkanivorans]|uniref:oligosaccharide flippase family protein n=1 Tax=Gordonia alkanivorans TaxID=84096 RepID=UPI00244CB997|nr:oligosaccharide flippase family protein [Gordonia alkanivorans]MDH3046684.1 oligosaccharide flippase family protein [Gordonia alkanivorans]MDJ0010344.1 oligosaccharide flippase family protein [Gordonia alkanivorans]MDJ0100109.1 oligosaccharide flippase family protein [Gordonia alkanivorans]MDJ0495974.1 oligosaccharide flippase family protein [Gordonia alkanivorans]